MKVKVARLLAYLKQKDMTIEDFAKKLYISINEVKKMLDGEAVGINTARKFISGLSVEIAQDLIDWDAIGVKNPLADEQKESFEDDSFDKNELDDFDDLEYYTDDYYENYYDYEGYCDESNN